MCTERLREKYANVCNLFIRKIRWADGRAERKMQIGEEWITELRQWVWGTHCTILPATLHV